jgi:hypothetical protein
MKLDALILADAVSTPPDGRFYVHGGGLTRYEIPGLPAMIPLGVLARLRAEDDDIGKESIFRFTLIGPTGLPNVEPVEASVTVEDHEMNRLEGEETFLNLGLQIPGLAVRDGLYRLELRMDGRIVRNVPLPVVVNKSLRLQEQQEPAPAAPAKASKEKKQRQAKQATAGKRKPPKRR